MAIRRGESWGEPGALPSDGVVARTDAEVRRIVEDAHGRGSPLPMIGLLGGDLCRTLGGRGDLARLRGPDARRLPVDVGVATVDGREHRFVAHLVARRSWLHGPIVAAMNAEFVGAWNVAPRAHPGDGRLDLVEADLGLGDRLKAWRRLETGTHVPHPGIRQRRVADAEIRVDRPLRVWLDGEEIGRASHVSLRVEPGVLVVVV